MILQQDLPHLINCEPSLTTDLLRFRVIATIELLPEYVRQHTKILQISAIV